MRSWRLNTPVAFLVFNRPETTRKVFEAIREARPPRLLVVADGPRDGRLGEAEKCVAVRKIIDEVDWPCEVQKVYSDVNLGCKKRVSGGLDWVFSTVKEAIILEDDCLPSHTFFRFCEELLERYRDDTRVMQICGFNRLGCYKSYKYSYYFSKYGPIWGWASWQRAWRYYDVNMEIWPIVKKDMAIRFVSENRKEWNWRFSLYNKLYNGEIDTWDYQWGFAKLINSGISIIPAKNLINNIGFGDEATHTRNVNKDDFSSKPFDMDYPLIHPEYVIRNLEKDLEYLNSVVPSKTSSILRKLKKLAYIWL